MKVITLLLPILFLSSSLYGQRAPIPNLPAVSLEEAGFNMDSIRALIPIMDDFEQLDFRGLIVFKDNNAVIEWYYNNTERTTIYDIRSAGKSITSLLLGVAIKEGLIKSLEEDVYSFFPKKKYPSINEDYRKVKIKHLLDMSSGLNADSDNGDSPGQARHWVYEKEWLHYLLGISLVNTPGEKWVYADINAALIGAIIEEKSGMSLRDYATEKVFEPLGIKRFYWYTNESNQTVAAGTLFLTALDFAKFGVLVTNQGKWGDHQIVEADYIDNLLSHQVFNISGYNPLADSYGMLWYKNQRMIKGEKVEYLWASGNGGNHLVVIPEKNMVVALTASAYGQWYGHLRARAVLNKLLNALD